MGKGQLENREWQEFPGISRVDANSGGGVDERDALWGERVLPAI